MDAEGESSVIRILLDERWGLLCEVVSERRRESKGSDLVRRSGSAGRVRRPICEGMSEWCEIEEEHGEVESVQGLGCTRTRGGRSNTVMLICDLCMKLGAGVLTGHFNKGAEREAPSGDSGERRVSPLEAALSCACVPWPTSGVPPLWSPGSEP